MNQLLPVTPLVVPLLTAIAALFARNSRLVQHGVVLAGAVLHFVCVLALFSVVWTGGRVAVGMGGWPAPYGIFVVVDTLSAAITLAAAFVHLAVTVHGLASADEDRRRSDFWPLANTLVMGVQGAFITGDLFNLYVWFEVLLLSSFVLVALGNARPQIESAAKYVVLNLLSSASFLVGIALVYGLTGTLNLADLAQVLRDGPTPPLLPTVGALFLVGFGIKAAMFPFSLWLPSAYGTPPATLAALLAGLLTKVGVYSMLRVGTALFQGGVEGYDVTILAGAFLSLFVGAVAALSQDRLRGVIVHTVVFAVGFMLLGLGTGTEAALSAAIFYLLSDMLVVTALLLLGGEVERITGKVRLADMGGLYRREPLLALAFLAVAFSVAGFPPFVGFWGKLALFDAAVGAGNWGGVLAALVGSALALMAIAQAWSLGLWQGSGEDLADPGVEWGRAAALFGLVGVFLALSVWP
ncbi:MAG: proton-conducting transporter membrane subunit, partial [Myxococcota bacterium]